jgi:hypothetical protein
LPERGSFGVQSGLRRIGLRPCFAWTSLVHARRLPPKGSAESTVKPVPDGDLIVFDATYVFFSAFSRFIYRFKREGGFRFFTAQSQTGRALYDAHGLAPHLMQTNIVII